MKRRDFLAKAAVASAAAPFYSMSARAETPSAKIPQKERTILPRRCGFNLLNMFLPIGNSFQFVGSGNYDLGPFLERDFDTIKSWGFDFVRLPLCYWCWSSEDDWFTMDERAMKQIDQAVEWGRQYGIHVNINFHRAPGYCVNKDPDLQLKSDLFKDEAPLEAFCWHWRKFAERYKGIPNSQLSFDLLNEPRGGKLLRNGYIKLVRAAVESIRSADPDRLICADGYNYGNEAVCEFADIPNFYQSSRGYKPSEITHFRARWMPHLKNFPEELCKWPMHYKGNVYDKSFLRAVYKKGWDEWENLGGAVHCGEMGCHNQTPAPVAYAWLKDLLDVFKERKWGWAMWRLSGPLGVLDSERVGAKFENFKGHKLDRQMLEILREGVSA